MKKSLETSNDAWKQMVIKVGVIGVSGTGKSSFTNAIRGITDEFEEGYAAVGETETTNIITEYPHTKHKNLVICDIPGVGTPCFPKEKYLQTIKVDTYDFFIIMTSKRFTELDAWLASELKKRNRNFYFVRTKIDEDVSNASRRKKKPETTVADIRADCEKKLHELDPSLKTTVFLVNNFDVNAFDFGKLTLQMVNDLPSMRRSAFVLSLSAISKELLEEKRKVLESRIASIAFGAAAAMIPIPGTGILADIVMIQNETMFYREQLGIDTTSMARVSKKHDMSVSELQPYYDVTSEKIMKDPTKFAEYLNLNTRWFFDCLHFINTFVGAGSFVCLAEAMNKILDVCVEEALYMNKKICDKIASQ